MNDALRRAGAPWTLRSGDPGWPGLWRELTDPPRRIRGIGDAGLLDRPALAVVGTRRASPRGTAIARELGRTLAASGWIVVSGLALGIDGAAHRGALDAGGATVAVMASGVDRTYPLAHAGLRAEIDRRGCVITERDDGAPPLRHEFPRRNRLVAGLCRGVVVVEAPRRSGALVTAMLAADQNREVFAVPGPIDWEGSRGCHHLLREGAHLVENLDDIRRVLEFPAARNDIGKRIPESLLPAPGSSARWLWDRLDLEGARLSELRRRWKGSASVWNEGLLALELAGLTRRLPGGRLARRMLEL